MPLHVMVVKIQRPLMTNLEQPQVLIYDKERTVVRQRPLEELQQLFIGNEVKIYHRAFYDPISNVLEIAERVDPPGW